MTEASLVSFDAHRVRKYLDGSIKGFLNDPPDSSFQAGFLAAVCIIYREALNNTTDDRITLCERLVKEAP
jgi:hypothetical protein